jgi:peptidoglycan/xylan/chitin deacetylase (PgdA/CDA1 family)
VAAVPVALSRAPAPAVLTQPVAAASEPTATASQTPLPSPTASHTATPSLTLTSSPTATPSPTATWTATPTSTPSPTSTPTATPTPIPWPTPDGQQRTWRIPILMYHYVSAPPADADAIRHDLSVTPEQFEEHLQLLVAEGYSATTLHDLALALQIGYPLPPKPIILTFDDGYRDHYTEAFPLLVRYGLRGTFFIITSMADQEQPAYVTWEQVSAMHAAGMEIGSHAYTHADLRWRSVDFLVWQMEGSKEAIEQRIAEPVRFFCYPSGKYDDQAIAVLHSANYWGAVTVEQGGAQSSERMFELQRIRIHERTDVAALAQALAALEQSGEGTP